METTYAAQTTEGCVSKTAHFQQASIDLSLSVSTMNLTPRPPHTLDSSPSIL